jgi:serine O-acetyltransferase
MKLSLSKQEFLYYTSKQLNNFFPDTNIVDLTNYSSLFDLTIDRLDFCFKHVSYPTNRYIKEGNTLLNHLYADHYLMYIWFLSNSIWKENGDIKIASKLYYLNKALHGFDCMYDTKLPDIFLVFHGVGTMLGKATYNDFFVCLQGCTVGSNKGKYPFLGKGVALAANSSVIGECNVGNWSSISASSRIFETDIPDNSVVFLNNNGKVEIKPSKNPYSKHFFNI